MSENRVPKLIELRDKCEEIKMLIRVTQELRVFKGFKKAQYLDRYEALKGTMELAEIKQFLSVQAPFAGHIEHVPDRRDKCPWGANSYKLLKKVGYIDEKNPFDYVRS